MKIKRLNWAAMALVPAAILTLTFTSCCSSSHQGGAETASTAAPVATPTETETATPIATPTATSTETSSSSSTSTYQQGVPGGIVVETYKTTATVTGIDPATRKVMLASADGTKSTIVAGPEVRNFDQIRVGDVVKATATRETAISLLAPGETRSTSETDVVTLAPKGAKPGAVIANTVEGTARIEALDLKLRTATLRFHDGVSKTVNVRKDVDMTKAQVGQEVLIRYTESVAIKVEKT